ncbi:efflux RND transporter permease subunit [Desulfoprunum benzoelyticum]|uniref:Cu(I)/Ag(I) efflux system membrane protein CusA/SilA n=1 Tax=Desulfoprunum benzoelyticum TaxID=1506996 RepID=A0A840URG5_9BACT|nr:CusA/CzcA family heavy metal efflux RND transporter [Desulfoprunum benzoelyticum]MBB5347416.1 Cu(I)/Ag(I) efflux system membrane protein CusA/SilA [Desulfoprunum benzoelyticum]MBM9529704.1 efflux RND transporter permease subunit [Desulfoprunum benzoelyticum]
MLEKIIDWSLRNTFMVILLTLFLVIGGIYALRNTPVDAVPDLSDVQVIVFTEYPGQAPQVVEDQVTYPLTTQMLAVPGAKVVRGYSFFGSSFVYIIFEDGTDMYWARSRVLEYLNYVSGRLPQGVTPVLGPDATGVGWIYEYIIESDRHNLQELRSIQDWYLRYELTSVEGVSEVASLGGFVKQYQVAVDPNKLVAYDIPLTELMTAIKKANLDVGGGAIEMGETEFVVRSHGYIRSLQDLGNIVVTSTTEGTPVLVKHLAEVRLGPEMRRGVAEWNGEGEAVGGIVVMRFGENALATIARVKDKLESLKAGLPPGVTIRTAYDRSGLIQRAIATLKEKLLEESIVVALVTMLFLFHLPSALVAIITLPVAILMAFMVMYAQGINANIMSLGGIAIAIGAMIDAAIIMIENAHKHLERDRGRKPHWQIIRDAAVEVGPTLFYSLLVITVSFVPVFTLTEQAGRLFKPLAFTKTYAMGAAAFLSITLVPVLMGWFIRGRIRPEHANPLNRLLIRIYHPLVDLVLRWRKLTLAAAVAAMLSMAWPLSQMGSEFMPALYEGDLLYMPTTLPGLSVTKAKEILQQTDRIIRSFPEVEHVFGKIGRAETATDPAPMMMIETTITLRPESEWRTVAAMRFYSNWPDGLEVVKKPLRRLWPEQRPITVEQLTDELNRAIQFPGLTNAWTMPIKTRIDMLSTGIKTPVGIKVMGDDLATLSRLGEEVEAVVRTVPGTLSAIAERVVGGRYLDIDIDRLQAARYGINIGDIQEIIQTAVGGMAITETVEGLERYTVNLRYDRDFRSDIDSLQRVLVPGGGGRHIPLGQLATVSVSNDPDSIKTENSRRTAWVYVDIVDIDVGTYVKNARQAVAQQVKLPQGYNIVWSGQYEYMEQARARLLVIIPLTVLIIFVIIFTSTKSLVKTAIVFLAVPFSLVGAFWLLYLLDYNTSIAVWVGIIALAGLDAETGVVMLLYLDLAHKQWREKGRMLTHGDLAQAIHHGAVKRIRPKIMTIAVIIAGLLPIMWSHGTGADVMKRIAAPMVGGVVTSGIMELLVYPVIFFIWRSRQLQKDSAPTSSGEIEEQ